jgi:hypothetical protein
VETRSELVTKSQQLAKRLEFKNMHFINLSVNQAQDSQLLPAKADIVTALHACNTATDEAIDFGLAKAAQYLVLVPCCQAEVAQILKHNRNSPALDPDLAALCYHPIHSREFGSHLTNVLRCLRLQAAGYQVTATELVGFEHSLKNELLIAKFGAITKANQAKAHQQLTRLIERFGLHSLAERFKVPNNHI